MATSKTLSFRIILSTTTTTSASTPSVLSTSLLIPNMIRPATARFAATRSTTLRRMETRITASSMQRMDYTSTGGKQIVVEQNLIHDVDLGIEMASEHEHHVTSQVIARNNLVYRDNSNGISIGGYAGNVGGTDHCTIVNNTLFADGTKGSNNNSGEFQIQFHATNNVFYNNIVYANTVALFLNNLTFKPLNPAAIDYNLYFSRVGAASGNWTWEGKNYTGYSTYREKTGLDANSPPFSDPQFLSTGNPPNLDIESSSPAVNAGRNLGENVVGVVDFAGNPRTQNRKINIGAYQQ